MGLELIQQNCFILQLEISHPTYNHMVSMKTNGTHTYTEACAAQRKQRAARWLKNTTWSCTCSWQRQLYGATWNGYKTKRLILTQMRRIWRNERIHLRLIVPQCVAALMIFSNRFNSFADSEFFFHSSKGFGSTIKSFVLCSENATLASNRNMKP